MRAQLPASVHRRGKHIQRILARKKNAEKALHKGHKEDAKGHGEERNGRDEEEKKIKTA
jgi:hypothetical protein